MSVAKVIEINSSSPKSFDPVSYTHLVKMPITASLETQRAIIIGLLSCTESIAALLSSMRGVRAGVLV